MSIRITEINAANIGPISSFSMRPGVLNLVYGRNESGKTALVEFILKCLFKTGPRSPGKWNLRGMGGTGKIKIIGLDGEQETVFSSSREKLDDSLSSLSLDMPENISRLLVARGAESAFADNFPGGASKDMLCKLLSNEDILGSIQDPISKQKNVVTATITGEEITGASKGTVQQYTDARGRIRAIDELIEDANRARASGNREELRMRALELDEKIDLQEKARRHRAYVLKRGLEETDERLQDLPADRIDGLKSDIEHLARSNTALEQKTAALEAMSGKRDNFEWLRHCRNLYGEYVQSASEVPGPKRMIVAGISALCSAACILLNLKIIAVALLAVSVSAAFS